jgi:2-oxoacid:acceptor oxidoreductase delta subunit (pyruvate/2-ketoisovalerate family)
MDAARTARRLGAAEAVVVYRRTRDRMPAHDIEVTEALDEGVTMRWLSTIKHADEGKLLIEKMRLDETGFPQPTGEFEELEADCLVLALGQNADLSVLEDVPGVTFSDNVTEVGPDLMTGHTWYYADAPATVRQTLEAARRVTTFDEVVSGLDESTALLEARRCMSCGNCFGCDNCYGVCPDNAIVKLADGQYAIDYDYCKGCGLCAAECPCGAIEMQPEQL